jgi:1-acyl-sn-glycerol-3-phosphate acyltransferase
MIPARHTWLHVRFFRWYTDYRIKRNFSSVQLHGQVPGKSGRPLLVIANHFSWWDGFFILWLNTHHLGKKFHVMMLEDQLQNNMILNKTGAFSIRRNSRDMVASLNYARDILAGKTSRASGKNPPAPLVLMYPQGGIRSMHARPLKFERGLERITRGLEGAIDILLVVVLTDWFSNQKPQLHMYLQSFPFNHEMDIDTLESTYNQLLTNSIAQQVSQNPPANP